MIITIHTARPGVVIGKGGSEVDKLRLAMQVARRLNHGYIQTLERSLRHRAVELDLSDVEDLTTRTIMLRTLREGAGTSTGGGQRAAAGPQTSDLPAPPDPEIQGAVVLRSRDQDRIEVASAES